MTALAIALGWAATLAFVAFIVWAAPRRPSPHDLMEITARLLSLENAAASPQCAWDEKRIKKLEDTVSILALSAGLKAKLGPQDAPQG